MLLRDFRNFLHRNKRKPYSLFNRESLEYDLRHDGRHVIETPPTILTDEQLTQEIEFFIAEIESYRSKDICSLIYDELKNEIKTAQKSYYENSKYEVIELRNEINSFYEYTFEIYNDLNEIYQKGNPTKIRFENFSDILHLIDLLRMLSYSVEATVNGFLKNFQSSNDLKPPLEPKMIESFYIGLSETELKQLYYKLVNAKFLKPSHEIHFVNAFKGCKRKEGSFEPIEWTKAVYAHLFIRINIDDIDNPKNKVWQRAEKIFNNGKASSLRNAVVNSEPKLISRHEKYRNEIEELIKSLR